MDYFFCITLSILVLRGWWKHNFPKITKTGVLADRKDKTQGFLETETQREKDLERLRRDQDTELIATVLPVIKDGQ